MLKPGGMLLFANFAAGIPDGSYMECFMDWRLIFRTESEMESIAGTLPQSEVAHKEIFRGKNRNVIYCKCLKVG
jgi:hypothetical protein